MQYLLRFHIPALPMSPKTPALLLAAALLPTSASSAASNWSFTPSGVFQHDYTDYRLRGGASDDADGARRSRLGLRARHASGLELRGEWDFASGAATDLFAELPLGGGRLRLGQYKQPFSLEELGSSRDLVLLERSQVHDASTIGRRVGVMWTQPIAGLQLQASAFAGNAEQVSGSAGTALRLVRTARPDTHLGVAIAYEQREDERLRLRARPESRLLPLTPLDVGNFREVDSSLRIGTETAWLRGSWLVQGEAFALRGQRRGADPDGAGAYLQASWLSGGHARSLRDGSLRKPAFEPGQRAWELSARLGRVEFDLGDDALGTQTQLGIGAAFYVGPRWQFALEHSEYRAEQTALAPRPGDYRGRFNSLRAQFSF